MKDRCTSWPGAAVPMALMKAVGVTGLRLAGALLMQINL
jgi:hypothetical protein